MVWLMTIATIQFELTVSESDYQSLNEKMHYLKDWGKGLDTISGSSRVTSLSTFVLKLSIDVFPPALSLCQNMQ